MKIMLLKDAGGCPKGSKIEVDLCRDDHGEPLQYETIDGYFIDLSAAIRMHCTTCRHLDLKTGFCTTQGCATSINEVYATPSLWEAKRAIESNIVTLIAPLRFKERTLEEYTRLSSEGNVVLLPVWGSPDTFCVDDRMKLHRKKLDMCSRALVINEEGYIGRGCLEEIGYCYLTGKPVAFISPIKNVCPKI